MVRIFFLLFISLLTSCGGSELEEENSNFPGTNNDFPSYVDSNNLRIFARQGVSEIFLKNVGLAYGEMMKENSKIDPTLKLNYLSTTKDKYVYQRVGIDGMANNSNFNPGTPPSPYGDNATDYIWQMSSGGEDQIGEVIEHLLHTATAVVLYLTHSQWDYNSSSSELRLAMQEAIDKNIYDVSMYDNLKGEDVYEQIITQEYAYWLILAEWNYFEIAGKKENGISGNEEFKIGTSTEIESQLPLGHKLYMDYIEKIFSIPDENTIKALFP